MQRQRESKNIFKSKSFWLVNISLMVMVISLTLAYLLVLQNNEYKRANLFLAERLAQLETENRESLVTAWTTGDQESQLPSSANEKDKNKNSTSTVPELGQSFLDEGPLNNAQDLKSEAGALLNNAPMAILQNPDSNNVDTLNPELGKAAMAIIEGRTLVKIAAVNLPSLRSGEAYYAWLVNIDSGDARLLGEMTYQASSTQAALLTAIAFADPSYRGIAVTRGRSATLESFANTVLSGRFDTEIDLEMSMDELQALASSTKEQEIPDKRSIDDLRKMYGPSSPKATSTEEGGNTQMRNQEKLFDQSNLIKALLGEKGSLEDITLEDVLGLGSGEAQTLDQSKLLEELLSK